MLVLAALYYPNKKNSLLRTNTLSRPKMSHSVTLPATLTKSALLQTVIILTPVLFMTLTFTVILTLVYISVTLSITHSENNRNPGGG